jgi:hypothetical protein
MPALGDPVTLQGTVAGFGAVYTAEKDRIPTVLLVGLTPTLLGKDHCWILRLAALALGEVQLGDTVELEGRPRIYVRHGEQRGTLSVGLTEPRKVRIVTKGRNAPW